MLEFIKKFIFKEVEEEIIQQSYIPDWDIYNDDMWFCVLKTNTWEVWKEQNCFNRHNSKCRDCCSGGMMSGAFCPDQRENIDLVTNFKPIKK